MSGFFRCDRCGAMLVIDSTTGGGSGATHVCPPMVPVVSKPVICMPDLSPDALTIRMILHCPQCRAQHIDEGELAMQPHKTHRCTACGHEWTPCKLPTVGVLTLE